MLCSLYSNLRILYFQTMNENLTNETLQNNGPKKLWVNQPDLVWLSIDPLLDTSKSFFTYLLCIISDFIHYFRIILIF